MNVETLVRKKLAAYKPEGNLSHTVKIVLNQMAISHADVKMHCMRVGLLAEATAESLKREKKTYFFAGILHDIGKEVLPGGLFDGHNISQEEYNEVKRHAAIGTEILKDLHLFCAMVAGLHHNVYQHGYGIEVVNFPRRWSMATVKKVIDVALVVSICDFIDAATHRATKIKDGTTGKSLRSMLYGKYPDDKFIIDIALASNEELEM